ncbi:hypothetical protein BDW22DRAFT_1343760 [Trametopsis cervina]|nr:hypothetical protein BDW22DRAFT_1343760 [Trametopsis cervina]
MSDLPPDRPHSPLQEWTVLDDIVSSTDPRPYDASAAIPSDPSTVHLNHPRGDSALVAGGAGNLSGHEGHQGLYPLMRMFLYAAALDTLGLGAPLSSSTNGPTSNTLAPTLSRILDNTFRGLSEEEPLQQSLLLPTNYQGANDPRSQTSLVSPGNAGSHELNSGGPPLTSSEMADDLDPFIVPEDLASSWSVLYDKEEAEGQSLINDPQASEFAEGAVGGVQERLQQSTILNQGLDSREFTEESEVARATIDDEDPIWEACRQRLEALRQEYDPDGIILISEDALRRIREETSRLNRREL